jgi:hypothetical protein
MTIMRKVLLATTALIAVGTVQAASADVTISGSYEWQYNTMDKSGTDYSSGTTSDNSISNEIDVNIGFSSTTDSGLSLAMGYSWVENDGTTGNAESVGATISGDFGTLGTGAGFGEFGDKFATAVDVTADPASPWTTSAAGDLYDTPGDEMVAATGTGINYLSPDMNGFQFSLGMSNAGTTSHADTTAGGFQYAMSAGDASITLKYAMSSTAASAAGYGNGIDASSLGLVIGYGDATITVASNSAESDNTQNGVTAAGGANGTAFDYQSSGVGVSYVVSDSVSVAAYTASTDNDKDSDYDVSENGVSFTYTIADGLSASVTHTDMDVKTNTNNGTTTSGNYTVVAVNLSF